MGSDTSYDLAYQLISDILSQQDILLSVNTSNLLLSLYNYVCFTSSPFLMVTVFIVSHFSHEYPMDKSKGFFII